MPEFGTITKATLKEIATYTLGFLTREDTEYFGFVERRRNTTLFPMNIDDPANSEYFLEIIPRTDDGTRTNSVIRCISAEALDGEESQGRYALLKDAVLYGGLDDSMFGSLLVVRCEDPIRGYSHMYIDRHDNIVQKNILGTEWFPSENGTRLLKTIRTLKLIRGIERLTRAL